MTSTDPTPETSPTEKPASHAKTTAHRLVNPGNIAAAAVGTGATIICSQLLPLAAYKAVTGLVSIVLIVMLGLAAYRRFFATEPPAVEEASDGR